MMKRILFVSGVLTFLCCMAVNAVIAGPALDSLTAAAGTDSAGLSAVFDGAVPASALSVQTDFFRTRNTLPTNAVYGKPSHMTGNVPVPEPVAVSEKIIGEFPLADNQQSIIHRAINTLSTVDAGKPLAAFLRAEGVEIKWAPLGSFKTGADYAQTCQPEVCGDKKIIYLDLNHKDLFLNSNPTFLAVALAHETTHLMDFKTIGSGVPAGTAVHLFLELNGWSTGVYVYNELLNKHIAPEPKSARENTDIQLIRLDLAIRNYMNGGERPKASDFPTLRDPAGLPSVDGLLFDNYVYEVTKQRRKGSMSLAGVVERTYGLPSSLENLNSDNPEYVKFSKLRALLGSRTANYLKWKDADAANAASGDSNGIDSPSDGPSGGNGGGGWTPNPHFHDGQ